MRRLIRFAAVPHAQLSDSQVAQLLSAYQGQRYAAIAPKFKMRPGMVYTQVRAISARVNQNFDGWPSSQLKKYWRTFIGKPIFVNHGNEDPRRARGRVIAARYVEKGADKYVEVIQEVDGKRYPKLAHEILSGGLDSVSMGVEAGFTICSVCDNRATDTDDMCDHIAIHKGEFFKNKRTGKRVMAYEKCYKLGFFELSYVFDPADETAVVSRVISASDRHVKEMGGGDELPEQPWFQPPHQLSEHETITRWHPKSEAYQDHPPVNTMMRLKDPSSTQVYDNASPEDKEFLDPLGFMTPYKGPPKQEYHVRQRDMPSSRMSKSERKREFMAYWYKTAFDGSQFGAEKAPEDIDTLRDESEDDTDLFHHWVESPPELQAPNMDQTERLDRQQEEQGLDQDRNSENAEDMAGPVTEANEPGGPQQPVDDSQQVKFLDDEDQDPVMPINPPEFKKSRRTKRSTPMSRYYYAADEDDNFGGGGDDSGADDYPGENDYSESGDDGGSDDDSDSDDGGGDGDGDSIQDLLDEAEDDIEAYEGGGDDGGDDSGGDDFGGDDDSDDSGGDFGGGDVGGDDDSHDDDGGDDSGGAPPWAGHEGRTVRKARSGRNKRGGAMSGSTLSERSRVAKRGRRHVADDSGYTDGGPYGVDDSQGAQEDVFISQVPGAEAVEAPTPDDSQVPNSPGNLVAYKRPQFDPNHYQRLADVVKALPPEHRAGMAKKMVQMFTADNHQFNGRTFYEEARVPMVKRGSRYVYAEDLVDPKEVDPALSGTDCQDQKGNDFESVALDDVETQPKDASIHAFRVFDNWLHQATGRTARQHANANFIRRAAATYANQHRNPQVALASLFPTLEFVLGEARKFEGANMRRQAEDKSLEVAAPQGRIDVEAPVKNVTDAEAQASQFDLGDFADNASDSLADPVLEPVDGNAGTWAPDKEAKVKLATAAEAVRLADAYIQAYPNKYNDSHRWQLTAQFETLRQPVVRDRIRVLEAVVEDQAQTKKTARKVTAASSRGTNGLPNGIGGRTAGRRKVSASDPDTDYGLFI